MAWADLVVLADRELALAREGRWEESRELAAAREALGARVAPPGPGDRPALEMLLGLQEQIVVQCTLARDAVARELSALTRGRGAVRGYRSTASRPAARVDGAA
jgi:hypothetical protein